VSAFVRDLQLLAYPCRAKTFVFFVPEALCVVDVGVALAVFELFATRAIVVDGFVA
jgi:hypothetical protein